MKSSRKKKWIGIVASLAPVMAVLYYSLSSTSVSLKMYERYFPPPQQVEVVIPDTPDLLEPVIQVSRDEEEDPKLFTDPIALRIWKPVAERPKEPRLLLMNVKAYEMTPEGGMKIDGDRIFHPSEPRIDCPYPDYWNWTYDDLAETWRRVRPPMPIK